MQDLAMHLLELLMNAVAHKAKLLKVEITNNTKLNRIFFKVVDDGEGMSEEVLKSVTDPFVTTRSTRKIGMGLAFLKSLIDQTDGHVEIKSKLNVGTEINFDVRMDHIDLPPLGNIGEMFVTVYNANPDIKIDFKYIYDEKVFDYNQLSIEDEVGSLDYNDINILFWIKDYINEGIKNL